MSKEIIEQQVYEPKIEDKKAVSFIWILPLIILAILGWIAYESYMKKGTNISVIFKSAEGLKENVIVGHLIPAGTGLREYEKLIVGSQEEYDLLMASKRTGKEELAGQE